MTAEMGEDTFLVNKCFFDNYKNSYNLVFQNRNLSKILFLLSKK